MAWKDIETFISKKFEEYKSELKDATSRQEHQKKFNEWYTSDEKKRELALDALLSAEKKASASTIGSSSGGTVNGTWKATRKGSFWTSSNVADHDLGTTVDTINAENMNAWIIGTRPSNNGFAGMGETFIQAGQKSGLDPRYILAHAALESAWGTSPIYLNKNNAFGIGAFDATPYSSAYTFETGADGIIQSAVWIAENYYNSSYSQKTVNQMHRHSSGHNYATDPNWANSLSATMQGSEKYIPASTGVGFASNEGTDSSSSSSGLIRPCNGGSVSSEYGPRTLNGAADVHLGIDIATSGDALAAASGTVLSATWHDSYGNYTIIDHGSIGGKNIKTLYAHQASMAVSAGNKVEQGQKIGVIGNTGNSFGVHLHFEVKINDVRTNPRDYVTF